MSFSIRSLAVLLCLLALGGCKVSTTSLGQGSILLTSANAIPCSGQSNCYEGGYNRTLTFSAQPAPGFVFTGWAGACSGSGDCTVQTLGNRHVVATFKTQQFLQPLMHYTPGFFFSGPWPTDLMRNADGSLNLKDYPKEKGFLYAGIKKAAETMHGFARNGVLYMPLTAQLDPTVGHYISFADGVDNASLVLVNLSPDSPHYLDTMPLQTDLLASNELAKDSLLAASLGSGYSLDASTTYGLILFAGSVVVDGQPSEVRTGAIMQGLINGTGSGALAAQWETIKHYVTDHSSAAAENVAAFSLFTTQPNPRAYPALRRFYQDFDYDTNFTNVTHFVNADGSDYGYLAYAACQGSFGSVRAYTFHAPTPRFLSGKPPYSLSGGRIQYDADGNITTQGHYTTTDITVVVPCEPTPADGWPVEIVAPGTGQNADDYAEEVDFAYALSHKVVQVIIPAPYPIAGGRDFPDGTENIHQLASLLGVNEENLLQVLSDVNPFNVQAILPNHLQYAGDMLYALNFIERYPAYLSQHPLAADYPGDDINSLADLKINPQQIAFRGFSLGAIAALHANAISDAAGTVIVNEAPRTQVNHVNHLVDWVQTQTGFDLSALLKVVAGVTFPMDTASPYAALIQTAVDPVDIINRVPELAGKNIVLGLAEYDDLLHGQEESYSFASAIGLAYGLYPINSSSANDPYPDWPLIPMGSWLPGLPEISMPGFITPDPTLAYGDSLAQHPVRIAVRAKLGDMNNLENGFLYQMSTGADFDSGYLPYPQ